MRQCLPISYRSRRQLKQVAANLNELTHLDAGFKLIGSVIAEVHLLVRR